MPQCSVNIKSQDQADDEPLRFTASTPPLRNQAILVITATSVSTAHYSSQYFLAMNNPILSSNLTALEKKICGKVVVITPYFKDELQ